MKGKQANVSHRLPSELTAQVETLAALEHRSRSNMIAVLLAEAVAAREAAAEKTKAGQEVAA
jgi:predicted transcriptional regulator